MIMALAIVSSVRAQDVQAIAERLDHQRYVFPQEKIHVMTDRGAYLAGDTLRLRAWVVDAATHQPVSASKFVYVELLSPTDSVCERVKIHQDDNGVFQGYLHISDDLPEGRYQLTAYTLFMQSSGTEYFYRQPVDIAGLMSLRQHMTARCVRFDDEVEVTLHYTDMSGGPSQYEFFGYLNQYGYMKSLGGGTGEARLTLKGKEAQEPFVLVEIDGYAKYVPLPPSSKVLVDFYPEGGYLVPGVENVVAFKMHDPNNLTVKASGELVDEQGQVVASLFAEHDGMGVVRFTPQAGGRYTARWRDNFDEYVTFELPQVRPEASVVQVRRGADGQVIVQAAGAHTAGAVLVLQQRGQLITASGDAITMNDNDFAPGVVQALLLDDNGHCLSERLFFAGQESLAAAQVKTARPAYGDREAVKVSVDLGNLATITDGGDCAVTVLDNLAAVASEGDIWSNLLLQSDLRGNIHAPEYYFEQGDSVDVRERARHLDMLMLTQGWRRYDIPRVLKGLIAEPQYPIEASQVVAGRVLSEWRKKPVPGAVVSLIIPKVEFATLAETDSLGCFSIPVPLVPEDVECIVLAENEKGKKQSNLELAQEQSPETYYLIDAATSNGLTADVQDEQSWRLVTQGDWRHVMLDELVVSASRRLRKPTIEANRYFTADDISRLGITSVDGALRAIGVSDFEKVNILIDGEPIKNYYFTDTETFQDALTLVTNDWKNDKLKRISYAPFNTGTSYDLADVSIADGFISMQNVDYIDFSRGRRGIITVNFSRKPGGRVWKEPSPYIKIAHPMGAQQPVEFYMPRYDQGDCGIEPGNDLRRVLYWNPNVEVGQDGKAHFDFYCNDAPHTTYTILIEGVTPGGDLIRGTQQVTKR